MKRQFIHCITLCFTGLLLFTTACTNEDVAPVLTESEVSVDLPSFDPVAQQITQFISLAGANNWMAQSELLMRVLRSGGQLTPAEIQAAEAELGISYEELDRLVTDLGTAAQNYTRAVTALNLSVEDQERLIRDAAASSALADFLQRDTGNLRDHCILQDICYVIGSFLVDIWLELTCDFFCEEEALPYLILVSEICGLLPC